MKQGQVITKYQNISRRRCPFNLYIYKRKIPLPKFYFYILILKALKETTYSIFDMYSLFMHAKLKCCETSWFK